MNNHDLSLAQRPYTVQPLPFSIYCTMSKCNRIMSPGTPVRKYDGATFAHLNCPTTPFRQFAAHKAPGADRWL